MEQIREHYVEVLGYAVLIEEGERNCGAHVPDLPGCYGLARTVEEIVAQMEVGIPFHIEGLEADGDPVPPPTTTVEMLAA
ncbi:type II toxin-antitoxin system HicB family antitoxin [Conexibacter arvalis]|uniref:Putative RNase H-like HicB family nuclease n=1 Tax=Conexibacter arvalis TaxID=912552 RepID=A0A840IDY0_9ACTN|nr:type II toxin-antitoxin system HicB family antitoxin [Conexibacter arvalis]MBB4663187.1 putative RNase H-like HicB family nuclease [Conexibacter arvalis]